jgi:thiamine-monophosphate kinase
MPIEPQKSSGTTAGGELELLSRIRRRAAGIHSPGLPLGIGDDCALIRPRPDEDLAVTTDLSVAGRHFRLEWHPPEAIGHRTLARGLSDLAAMGARPVAAFLSLGLPRELTRPARRASAIRGESWLDRFLNGFLSLARAHQAPLAGGDLAESPLAAADIVLIGAVPRGRALLRSGASPGDAIYVTGALGGAAAAFARLAQFAGTAGEKAPRAIRIPQRLAPQLAPHLYPQPRLAQGQWLVRRRLATAAIDISDGLSTDLAHICDESGMAAEIEADALPLHHGATLGQALNGGEDYELLFTAPASARLPRSIAGVAVTRIGRVVRRRTGRPQVVLLTAEREPRPLQACGWQHFA